jgi:predicted signal transduction protein with EAL and GGDEF domain
MHDLNHLPADEQDRLAELLDFGILDTEPDEDYDRLVQLAASLCNAPMAALTLVDSQRQWFKSRVGFETRQTPRDKALCAQAILDASRLLEIADTAIVNGFDPHLFGAGAAPVHFYAGAPLQTRAGSAIGTLCVMDQVPRELNEAQRDALGKLSKAVSAQLSLRRQLREATQTDRLTGLPNWFHFESQFDTTKPAGGVVTFVRLRTVSQIGSAHGFRVADGLIKQTADRLRSIARHGAIIGRIKRGLFILLFPDMDPDEFRSTKAAELGDVLQAPYVVNGLTLVCPVNLGFASFPRDGLTLDEVVNAADNALQMAIERDESHAFFDKSVDNQLSRHYRLEPALREALAKRQFINYYQPKVDVRTGAIVGVEALIRWIHPERGLIAPMEFVPALESTGLIRDVGRHIIERAVADWESWRAAGLRAPRIAVNVASAQLRHAGFLDELSAAHASVGGDEGCLSIEVTESVLISNMDRAIAILSKVRDLGIPVAIDDFGTGYSSLAYIVTLPIDEVKIDRSFIKRITSDAAYKGIVDTCISLSHNLGLTVVAEGVETKAQADMLRKMDCDHAQGFYYSPPVPAEELARILRLGHPAWPAAPVL